MNVGRRAFLAASAASTMVGPAVHAQTVGVPAVASLALNLVTAQAAEYHGRQALKIALTDARQRVVTAGGAGAGNEATVALLPGEYGNFVMEADIAAEVNGKGPPDVRGFAGLAFRADPSFARFEAIYLRMTNGTLAVPPPGPPRDVRAVQYIAHPDFHFDVSRARAPGVYEKAAPVAPARWLRVRLEVEGPRARFLVDGTLVLDVADLRSGANGRGRVGLFVDDGTDGFFANVSVRPA